MSLQWCNQLWQGRSRFSGQMQGDMECPFSGVTNYGRVCRMGARKQGLELVRSVYMDNLTCVQRYMRMQCIHGQIDMCTQRYVCISSV